MKIPLASPHFTSTMHLILTLVLNFISCTVLSFLTLSSQPHPIPSYPISSKPISFHFISSYLISLHFISSHLYLYLYTPLAGGSGSLKPEPSPYNPGMYGSNFNSQRTSLESNSDYSAYLSANSNNFITPDMVDNRQKDHHSLKGSISRSMSGYTHSTIPDAPRQSRSFSGFPSPSPSPSDTIILGEQNSFSGSMPKSDPFGQFVGFGPIGSGSGSGSSIPSPGFKNGSMYDRGPDSYSSEVSTTEDGMESMRDPTGHYLMPQYRERDRDKEGGGHGHGDYMNRNLGPSGEHSAYRDQFHDGVRSSVSRSSSFDSTLDSLNSYKHISVGPEDDHPIRRGAFVLRDPYTPGGNTAAPSSHAFPMHHQQQHLMQQGQGQGLGKPFDIRRSNPNLNVSLQDVRECLEEDNSHDFASHDANSPGPGTIKMIRRSDTDPGSLSFSHLGMNNTNNNNNNMNNNGSFDQSRGEASTGALDRSSGVTYSGMSPSSSHSVGAAVPGGSTAESNEQSNIDSYHPDMRGGSNLSSFDNESINFNNTLNINRHDIVINNDDTSSNYPGNGSKYYFDSNGHNSNPVPCSSSLSTHIHFGAPNGNGGGSNSSASASASGGAPRLGQREGGGELSDYDNTNTNKAGFGLSMGVGADTNMGRGNGNGFRSPGNGHGHGTGGSLGPKSVGSDGSHGQGHGQGLGQGQGLEEDINKDDEERMPFSRRPSSALSEPTADYLQDDFTLLTTDTQTFVPLDKWMIKVWLHIVFSGFDSDIIEGFISKLRDDGGFVTVQVCRAILVV